jgi:hypothetical protein
VYKSKLEAAEIPVLLRYESVGPVLGITVDGLGRVEVMVPADLEDEARDVLADLPDDWIDEEEPSAS